MKKVIFLFSLVFALTVYGQEAQPYFNGEELPNALHYLPAPPKGNSAKFEYDKAQYFHGKKIRATERGEVARKDAEYSIRRMSQIFSKPFGIEISQENTPQIWKLLTDAAKTADLACDSAKMKYMRPRPYMVLNEPTLVPEDEEVLSHNGSYPSGHTTLGWTTALLLLEINPTMQDELLRVGFEYGQSRVIAGFHWQSDVDAGRLVASAALARMHTNKTFLKQLKKAQKEYLKKSKKK